MNKANAKRALMYALDCIDSDDIENAREYALIGLASLCTTLVEGKPVYASANASLIDEVRRGVVDSESLPLFDDGEPKDGSGYRYGDDGAADLKHALDSARRFK